MRFRNRFFLIIFLSAAICIRVSSQTWIVPDEQKAVVAPFKFTPGMQKQGEQIYLKNCQSCHGLPGKDNWAKLTPPPGDLSKDRAQKQTDGELFYRITTGKSPMPEFRNIIPEDERWWVIAFLRSFNPKYVQPAPAVKKAFTGRIVTLAIRYDEQIRKVVVAAHETRKEAGNVPAAGVEVMLFIKRYFGNLPIGDIRTTNGLGEAFFEFPAGLPGNGTGNVDLTAQVNDPKNEMKATPAKATLAIGVPTHKPGLTDTRAMWSTREKAPVWILLTFTISVAIVWGFILYIVYTMSKIRKAGIS